MRRPGGTGGIGEDGAGFVVHGAEQIGEAAAGASIVLYELTPLQASLEEAFMDVTRDDVQFHASDETPAATPAAAGASV